MLFGRCSGACFVDAYAHVFLINRHEAGDRKAAATAMRRSVLLDVAETLGIAAISSTATGPGVDVGDEGVPRNFMGSLPDVIALMDAVASAPNNIWNSGVSMLCLSPSAGWEEEGVRRFHSSAAEVFAFSAPSLESLPSYALVAIPHFVHRAPYFSG
jgi:hypothetical protein